MDSKVIRLGAAVLVGALLIMTIALLSVSFKKLNSDEVGLKYNVITKSLDRTVFTEGLHYGPPGFYFIIFPSVFKTLLFEDLTCLNKDGVEIQLDVTYQYQVKPKDLHRVVMQFKDHEGYRQILSHEGSAAIYETCAQYNTSQFQSERGGFQSTLRELILKRYSALECNIKDLQVNNIVRPSKYEAAIKSKESAKETISIVLNERPKKLTTARTGMLKARTQAQIMVEKSRSDARITITKAESEAAAILDRYDREALTYSSLRQDLKLSAEGLLSYLAVRTISKNNRDVFIGMKGPAKTSYLPARTTK